jgi:hypothetical protein
MTTASVTRLRLPVARTDTLRGVVLAAALLSAGQALPLAAQAPVADTVGMSRVFAAIAMQGAHLSAGVGRVPYQGGSGSTLDLRFGLTPRALPEWTFAVAGGFVANARPTEYEVSGRDGFRPNLETTAGGIEVQRRWTGARRYHPIATVGIGTVSNSYAYKQLSDGALTYYRDELRTTPYVSAGAGGEVRISRRLRASGVAAYRAAGPIEVPHGRGTNGGVTMVALLSAGWF